VRLRLWTTATIPHLIYEHGEPLWSDIDKGRLFIRPSESLVILPAVI
jgi:hypothetical protein